MGSVPFRPHDAGRLAIRVVKVAGLIGLQRLRAAWIAAAGHEVPRQVQRAVQRTLQERPRR